MTGSLSTSKSFPENKSKSWLIRVIPIEFNRNFAYFDYRLFQ